MTKIKNTKKGMAKKTLSISLAVAMLATSNVPVWAAEDLFTDGEVAVEAFTAEEAFSDEAAPAVEAPVVEEEDAVDAQFGQNENPTTDSRIVDLKLSQHGWASYVTVSGKVLDHTLKAPLQRFNAQWVYKADNGAYRDASDVTVMTDTANGKLDNLSGEFIPTADLLGKELYLHVFLKDAKEEGNNIDIYLPAGTVDREDITNRNADDDTTGGKINVGLIDGKWDSVTSSHQVEYTGKEVKPRVDANSVHVKFDNGSQLGLNDFSVEYKNPRANLIDVGSDCVVELTPTNTKLYKGYLEQKYSIVPREYKADDIAAKVTKSYEYTGEAIIPGKEDIELIETIRDNRVLDSKAIEETWISKDTNGSVGAKTVYSSLRDMPNYQEETLPKKGQTPSTALRSTFNITKRDLSNCTVEIDPLSINRIGSLFNNAKADEYVHIYDATGKELKLTAGTDYIVVNGGKDITTNGTYPVTVKALNNGNMVGGSLVETSLTVTSHDFADLNFVDPSTGHSVDKEAGKGLLTSVPYTGEKVEKDVSKLMFARWNPTEQKWDNIVEGQDYKVTVEGVDAGKNKGCIIVEGLRSYEGAKKVLKFDIDAAEVAEIEVTAKGKVVFNRANTLAEYYAPTITGVGAHNTATPAKTFKLEEGKDYTVKYSFVPKVANTTPRNEIGAKVRSVVSITNPNFQGGQTVFERETLISRKQITDCNVEVLGTYTYTGAAIIPDVKVTDANGEVLVKDVDYVVTATNNINVTDKAVVKVYGKDENEAGDAIYDPESFKETNFTITPANAEDVEVEFADGNTGVVYTGKPVKPTAIAVKLNGNDVTEQFNISYPGTYINVGKAMAVLTPVDYHGYKNFVGTKEASFDIIPRTLEGTLTVFDKDGHKYTLDSTDGFLKDASGEKVVFDYDGEEQKFFDAEFVPGDTTPNNNDNFNNYAGYVTKDDYEIKYVDNVYGGTAHIYVEGKGNFAGASKIYDAENNVVDSVVSGTDYKYSINVYELKSQHVKVEAAEYAAGQTAKPNVTVTVFGQKLVEGTDYTLSYGNRAELTNGKTEKVVVKGIKAFRGTVEDYYAVVKRDMANTDITVTERSNGTFNVVVRNSGIVVPESEYTLTFDRDSVTVTAKEDSKYYTGSQTKEIEKLQVVKPDAPVITDAVVVNGNSVKVTLANAKDGATGYDYVIDTDRNCTDTHKYYKVNKNVLNKNTTFTYTQSGAYWVYCHSWVRDENGQKVFSDWSNPMPVIVDAVTPAQPKVTKVSVSGSTVKVTYTTTEGATGYDVVLGSAVKAVAGEKRPVEYGTLVKKNIMGNTVTATFKNVPAGIYYAGLHAFNRTSADGKKVFSPWSESKKITVK